MLRIDGMEKGMVVKYQKLGFLQTKGKKTPWKVPAVYSKIDDRLKKQPMGQEESVWYRAGTNFLHLAMTTE